MGKTQFNHLLFLISKANIFIHNFFSSCCIASYTKGEHIILYHREKEPIKFELISKLIYLIYLLLFYLLKEKHHLTPFLR